MALLGGAGHPVGGSFTGPAEALELTGDRCYSYSGVVELPNNTMTTMNKFTTGNYITKLEVEIHGEFVGIAQSQHQFEVKMNGAIIIHTVWAATQDSTMFDYPTRLIIPPYTEVEVNMLQAEGNPQDMQTTLTGRIYRQ